jgi:hypothetical protein
MRRGCSVLDWRSHAINEHAEHPIGAPSPQPYFDRLAAAVERLNAARSLSRQLHTLAEEAPIDVHIRQSSPCPGS